MTTFKRTTGFLALAACLLAAGCGSDDEGAGIPRSAGAALENQLDSIQNRVEFGGAACNDITEGDDPNTTPVQKTIDGLPSDVDPDVRQALQDGFDRLFQLVDEQCQKPETETDTEPETETVTEPPPTPTVTETQTTPPETTETTPPPPETTEPPPTDTEEQVPPSQGGNAPGGEGGNGSTGQGGDANGGAQGGSGGVQGGSGGGALVPGDEG